MNFSQGGIPEQKFDVNRACFPEEKLQNSQKWPKFMNFSFWPFLWFGLPGRLLIFVKFGDIVGFNGSRCGTPRSEELKKAVAVSEEKIQQRSRRRGQFSSSHFPCRKVPKPWQG